MYIVGIPTPLPRDSRTCTSTTDTHTAGGAADGAAVCATDGAVAVAAVRPADAAADGAVVRAQPCTRPVVHAANQWRSETRMQSKAKSRAQPMRNVVTCAHGGADARAAVAQSRQAAGGRPAGWRVARVGSCLRDEKAIRPPRRNPRARPQPTTQEDGNTDREGNTYTTLTPLAQTPS